MRPKGFNQSLAFATSREVESNTYPFLIILSLYTSYNVRFGSFCPFSGSEAQVKWILNTGRGSTKSGRWTDKIFMSPSNSEGIGSGTL